MRKERGITLIALVVTIVVLLILAGVSIQMLTGDNGVITQAQKSKENTRIGELEEAVNLWEQERMIAKTTGGTQKTMEEILEELVERGALTDEEAEKIINDENNEIKIGDKTISFKTEIEVVEPKKIDDWEYIVEDNNTVTITNYKGTDIEVIIPNYINGIPVKKITGESVKTRFGPYVSLWDTSICKGNNNYRVYAYGQNTIKKVTISDGIEVIGDSLFELSETLEEVRIPLSIKEMGKSVFNGCGILKKVNIPSGVTSIEDSEFYFCRELTNISIPDSVTNIGMSAFNYCTSLKNIDIPNKVTSIKSYAFGGCESLTSINIPNSVTIIEDYAFTGCSSLTSINIPKSVTNMGENVFKECSNLTTINLEASAIPDTWNSNWKGDCTATVNTGVSM